MPVTKLLASSRIGLMSITRKRERVLQWFKSAERAQHFLVSFSAIRNHFRPRRHRLTASAYRHIRTERYAVWRDVTLAGVRP